MPLFPTSVFPPGNVQIGLAYSVCNGGVSPDVYLDIPLDCSSRLLPFMLSVVVIFDVFYIILLAVCTSWREPVCRCSYDLYILECLVPIMEGQSYIRYAKLHLLFFRCCAARPATGALKLRKKTLSHVSRLSCLSRSVSPGFPCLFILFCHQVHIMHSSLYQMTCSHNNASTNIHSEMLQY